MTHKDSENIKGPLLMPKLPVVGEREVLKALKKAGFIFSFQAGSHATFKHPITGKRLTVPLHRGKDFKKGTLRNIIRQADLSVDEFIRYMK